MLNTETLIRVYRHVTSRKLKALALNTMQRLGMRYLVVRMDTTNLCNLRCIMCEYSSDYLRKRADMDASLFDRIAADLFPRTRFLYLSCITEPLMNKQFAKIVRSAGAYRIPFTSFCTNGQLLTEEIVQTCIDSKVTEIVFSIDGATAETYEHIRRGAKWDRLLERLTLLSSLKQRAGVDYPAARLNFTCMARNIQELPAMVAFAADYGISSVHVRHLLAYVDGSNTCAEEMSYLPVFNKMAEEARKAAALRGVRLFLPDLVPQRGSRKASSPVAGTPAEANPYCLLPWFHVILTASGEYRTCSTHRVLGNLREQSFDEIYNGARMCEIRRSMLGRTAGACSWTCREEAYEVPNSD
jgi:MoaA/NifB/PqqE/SkfB family radical SAM enzyme